MASRPTSALILVAVIALSSPLVGEGQSANAQRRARAEALTVQLLEEQLQPADPSRHPARVQRLTRLAAARRTELVALMQDDPGAVLRVAVKADLRRGLPAAVQPFVEEEVVLEGEVIAIYQDFDWGARLLHFLDAGQRRVRLHFANDRPDVLTGQRVRVRGVLLGDDMASEGSASVQPVTSVLPRTFGEQRVLLILVNFQDKQTQPWSIATAQNLLFNTVNNFYLENSQSQTWLTGDVAGWFTVDESSKACNTSGIASKARSAAQAAGYTLSAYSRFIYAFPSASCGFAGQAYLGGNPSHAWINGALTTRVVGHELGHNLGLYHAHGLNCGGATLGPSCTKIEYGDPASILGISGTVAHFTPFEKERLGWLNYGGSAPMLTITGPGSFTLDPYAGATTAPKALKILKEVNASGRRTFYYVAFRRGMNFDNVGTNLSNGVMVNIGTEANGDSGYALDMTPSTSSFGDAPLAVGRTFTDPLSGISLTTAAAGSSGAVVQVEMGPIECVTAAPSVTLAPSATQWGMPGSTITWTMSVTNNDSAGCSAGTFSMSGAVPAGWSALPGTASLTLPPGATASTILRVTSTAGAENGFYTVRGRADASNGTPVGDGDGTYAVLAGLTVEVSGSIATQGRNGRNVVFAAHVSASGSVMAGVPVSFSVRKPDGKMVTSSTKTNAAGVAEVAIKAGPKDPAGTWTATATASYNGVTGSGTGSVAVP